MLKPHKKNLVLLSAVFFFLVSCQSTPVPVSGAIEIQSGGISRELWLHIPALPVAAPRPAIILLHPTGSNGIRMVNRGNLVDHADRNGFAVVAPDAIEGEFNYDRKSPRQVDDVRFIEDVIDWISRNPQIDDNRIYLAGFSTGGLMAIRFILESDKPVAGMASVAAMPPTELPERIRPVSTIFIVGDSDPMNPVKGLWKTDGWLQYPPARAFRVWAKKMNCGVSVSSTINIVRHSRRSGCDRNVSVVYLQVENMGHYWPKPVDPDKPLFLDPKKGPFQPGLDATAVIWDFFRQVSP